MINGRRFPLPALSLREREAHLPRVVEPRPLRIVESRTTLPPLPWGEGRGGEGNARFHYSVASKQTGLSSPVFSRLHPSSLS